MRFILFHLLACCLFSGVAYSGPVNLPGTNDVVRYERQRPVFKSREMSKERGEALLKLLDGGTTIEPWVKDGTSPEVLTVQPPAARLEMTMILKSGETTHFTLARNGKAIWIGDSLFAVKESAAGHFEAWMEENEADLCRELAHTSKPCTYQVGTADDGGTLYGVARIFYGDSHKWKQIYEANRSKLKNPNLLKQGEKLKIPKL